MLPERRSEVWLVWDSDQVVTGVHSAQGCSGRCVVHNPSNHWMREFPLAFDVEKSSFYRICTHGNHHQDPDERTRWTNIAAKHVGKRVGRSAAQEKLEQWDCPACICECCSVVAKYLK